MSKNTEKNIHTGLPTGYHHRNAAESDATGRRHHKRQLNRLQPICGDSAAYTAARRGVLPLVMLALKTASRPLVRGIGTKGGKVVNSGLEHAQIPETQFQQWSEQVSGQSLPLKTFLTQHRPLMAVPLHINPSTVPHGAQNPRDVMFVGAWRPKSNIFSDVSYQSVPLQIAQELGPFSVGAAAGVKEQAAPAPIQISRDEMPRNVVESVGVLGQFLREYNSQGGEGAMMHLPLHEGRAYLEFDGEVDATSVRRKRKLKMNRHKYRKRLKEQRTLRRRLNSGK